MSEWNRVLRWGLLGLAGMTLLAVGSAESRAEGCGGLPRQVVDALVNEELDRAEHLVARWLKKAPKDPLPRVEAAMVKLVKAYHTEDPARRKRLESEALDQAERATRPLGWQPDAEESAGTLEERLARGYALSLQAVIRYNRHQDRKAYDLGYRGHQLLQDVIAEDPSKADAYLPLGLYEYYLGKLPPERRRGARLLDLSGDADLGVRYLEQAVQEAPVVGPEAARVLLVQLGLSDAALCRYRTLAAQMHRRYPGNRILGLVAQIVPLQCRILESEGEAVAEDAGSLLPEPCGRLARR